MNAVDSDNPRIRHPRVASVDILRGLIMVLMVLDHIRGQWLHQPYDALDLSHTTLALFMTRWVTHICAPMFVFLAGVGIALALLNGKSKKEMSKYLFFRGLLLICIEIFVISKFFIISSDYILLQVIWVIGFSMILLAGLIWLPEKFLWAFSVLTIVGHNLLDKIVVPNAHGLNLLWILLHQSHMQFDTILGVQGYLLYPLIPWVGVMILGYLFGKTVIFNAENRAKKLIKSGLWLVIGFVIFRTINIYGNPQPWSMQSDWVKTVLSFINCEKYPPSLDFLLMTIGPGLLLLGFLDDKKNRLTHFFEGFGRVPFFFYLIHLPLIIVSGAIVGMYKGMSFDGALYGGIVSELIPVYIAWLGIVLLLYPLCLWYAKLKKTKTWFWLKYF